MLQVITGHFHPHLESALVDRIAAAKSADPLTPTAVLVPSAPLRDRLIRLLTVDAGLSLLNVHLLTFHQLALRLADERRHLAAAPAMQVVGDLFFEQLIRRIVHRDMPSLALLKQMGQASGAWGALWSTIRDLKDAGVDPGEALRGVRERYFGHDDQAWLTALFSLHAAVLEAGRTLDAGTADDLAASLLSFVPESRFIASLRQAFYYGFYDLTQIQLDFFSAVSRAVPATLLYPLAREPAYAFAQRFFERHIQPLAAAPDAIADAAAATGMPTAEPIELSVRSVIGADEELASACRTILDLVETNGYRFDEIGVVARSLDAYRSTLPALFDRHRVPFTIHGGRPLIHEPVAKLLLQLAALPVNDYYRTTVLEVVSSPFYHHQLDGARSDSVRPELWKLLVSALGITRGQDEWARVEQVSRATVRLASDDEETGGVTVPGIDADVVATLWQTISRLLSDCAQLPSHGPVSTLIDAFTRLLDRHVQRLDGDEAALPEAALRLTPVWEALDLTLAELKELTLFDDDLTWEEFVTMLTEAVERTTVHSHEPDHLGVTVLDAMAARGLPFKALFVLGLNEKVFPRYIREDAFLRDRHRQVLAATLGFKIDEKLTAYDEEALLFALLCQSAGRRLYLSYQRADDNGRTAVPSPYLAKAGQSFTAGTLATETVPRRLTDRLAQRPSLRAVLPPSDLAIWMAISNQDPSPLLAVVGHHADAVRHGLAALEHIDDETPALTAYDGLTGTLDTHLNRVQHRGIAPTPLERYGRCPFQYYAAEVLNLESVRRPAAHELNSAVLGTVAHAALRYCYEALLPTGWPADPVTDDTIAWCIHSAVERAAGECEATCRTGHDVLWEVAKDTVIGLVTEAVESDEAAYAEHPFVPVAFEADAEGTLPDGVTMNRQPVKIHGRFDRIDRHRQSGELRVVDYKIKVGSHMKTDDRHLLQAAVRAVRLQPPFYAAMHCSEQPPPIEVQLFFLAPKWSTPVVRSTFRSAAWDSPAGSLLRTTIATLLNGIRDGRFFIVPDSYCDTCDFRTACRREHGASWWRASRARETHVITSLRTLRVPDE